MQNNLPISPRLMQRERGDWLATAPTRQGLVVGVIADTEPAARIKFHAVVAEWRAILKSGREHSCPH